MKILPLFVLLACMVCAHAQENDDTRPIGSRGLPKRGPLAKAKHTTTTTTLAPEEEAEYQDEEEYSEVKADVTEVPVSSTEGKKLVAGGVRPFRSNTDLLEALKRRRAQAAEAKHQGSATATTSAVSQDAAPESKSSYSKKRTNIPREVNNEDAPAPPKSSRGRFGKAPSKLTTEPELEEPNESAPTIRNSRFSKRGGN